MFLLSLTLALTQDSTQQHGTKSVTPYSLIHALIVRLASVFNFAHSCIHSGFNAAAWHCSLTHITLISLLHSLKVQRSSVALLTPRVCAGKPGARAAPARPQSGDTGCGGFGGGGRGGSRMQQEEQSEDVPQQQQQQQQEGQQNEGRQEREEDEDKQYPYLSQEEMHTREGSKEQQQGKKFRKDSKNQQDQKQQFHLGFLGQLRSGLDQNQNKKRSRWVGTCVCMCVYVYVLLVYV